MVSTATVVSTAAIAMPTAVASVALISTAIGTVTASIAPAESMVIAAPISISPAAIISMAVTVSATVVAVSVVSPAVVSMPVITSVVARPVAAIVGVVPGTRSDENATDEVVRPVIPVRRTGVRIVGIVAVHTLRRWAKIVIIVITWPNPNAHRNLGLGQ